MNCVPLPNIKRTKKVTGEYLKLWPYILKIEMCCLECNFSDFQIVKRDLLHFEIIKRSYQMFPVYKDNEYLGCNLNIIRRATYFLAVYAQCELRVFILQNE